MVEEVNYTNNYNTFYQLKEGSYTGTFTFRNSLVDEMTTLNLHFAIVLH